MLGIEIRVDYKQLKEAGTEAVKVKKELEGINASTTTVHATGSQRTLAEMQRANEQIFRMFNGAPKAGAPNGNWNNGVYTSPGGVKYGRSGGTPQPSFIGDPVADALGSGIGRLAKYTGAALGIGGTLAALNWLNNAGEKSKVFEIISSDLQRRGGNIDAEALKAGAAAGLKPLEMMATADIFNTQAGFQGEQLKSAGHGAAVWSKRFGIPVSAVAGFQAGSFHTGADITRESSVTRFAEKLNQPVALLYRTAVALGARGRIEEVLRNNQAMISDFVAKRGGHELSDRQRESLTLLQMGMWSQPGQMGKGAAGIRNFADMDSAIRAGGTDPGSQIMMARALGIDRVRSRKELWEFYQRQEEGATPRNIKAVLDQADRVSTGAADADYQSRLILKASLGLSTRQIDFWTKPGMKGILDLLGTGKNKSAVSRLLNGPEAASRLKEAGTTSTEIMSMLGNQYRVADAQSDVADILEGKTPAEIKNDTKRLTTELKPLAGAIGESLLSVAKSALPGNLSVKPVHQVFKEHGIKGVSPDKDSRTGTLSEMIFGKKDQGTETQRQATAAPTTVTLDRTSLDVLGGKLDTLIEVMGGGRHKEPLDMRRWREAR